MSTESITIVTETRTTPEAVVAVDHVDDTRQMLNILESVTVMQAEHAVTIGSKKIGTTVTTQGQEMTAGTGTDTGIRGCTGMCPGCRMECLAESFQSLVDPLTKYFCSVRGQFMRLLKEF